MQENVKILIGIKNDFEALKKQIEKMCKTHAQVLKEEWVTSDKVMEILKISPRTLQKLRDNAVLPFSKVEGTIYYNCSDIDELLNMNYNNR